MIRDYQIVSPSLEGVLNEEIITYEGLKRPRGLLRVLDGPASVSRRSISSEESDRNQKVLEDYFHDLYGIFMKKLSYFIVDSDSNNEENVKLQAMLQEMIKVKMLINRFEK